MTTDTTAIETTNQVSPTAPAVAYLAAQRSAAGRASVENDLRRIAAILKHTTTTARGRTVGDWRAVDWRTLDAANVKAVMARIAGAPATRNHVRAVLRGVAREVWRMGGMKAEELARINDVKGDAGTRLPAGRQIEPWEVDALLKACADDPTPAGARDAAMLATAWATGARREELTRLDVEALRATADGFEHAVIGKRNKERTLYITNGAAAAMRDWLTIRGTDAGPVFCAIAQSGTISPLHRMTTTALHLILAKRIEQAGLKPLSWHDFRRSYISSLLDMGEDVSTVAALVGHSSVTTTARYDRRPEERRRQAARKVSTPYRGRQADA
jgi:site-specific recombinase XerD